MAIWPHWEEAFWPASWSNWALAALALWAGCLALKTMRAIQKQAKAQMDADRAWILASVHRQAGNPDSVLDAAMGGVICQIEVVGSTPARILSEKYRYRSVPAVAGAVRLTPELEKFPVYPPGTERRKNPIFLTSGKFSTHVRLENVPNLTEIQIGRAVLCAYGRIDYEDAFGRKAFTQFCAIYQPRHGSIAISSDTGVNFGGFYVDGPKGYNHNT